MKAAVLAFMAAAVLFGQTDGISRGIAALQRGDAAAAEQELQAHLKSEPRDPEALSILGVIFDQEKKYGEAEDAYNRALAAGANDPSLLNNYGNHLLVTGHPETARQMFLRAVRVDAANRNANIQLAKLAIDRKSSVDALTYLGHLPKTEQGSPDVQLLFGIALSAAGRYGEAEERFRNVTTSTPDDFQAQYDLGLAASKAKHYEQAEQALKRALELRPDEPGAIYDLAVVELKQRKSIEAIALLAKSPDRPETQRLLAEATLREGYFADSIKAWDRYLAPHPQDQAARRERAFAATAIGQDADSAMQVLTAFVKAHPQDAAGHYELGTALSSNEPERAAQELSQAIRLDSRLTGAYMARGLLAYRGGDNTLAERDFKVAADQEPDNARILDRLAEAKVANGHPDEALQLLRRAAQLAPRDSAVLLHLGRALMRVGQKGEAETVFARYRQAGASADSVHESGLIEFLSLPPGEQQARYREGVERTVAAQPQNVEAQVKLLEILLNAGETNRADEVCRTILSLKPSAEYLSEAGQALLDSGQYRTAEEFVKKGMSNTGPIPSLQLELAQARFYTVEIGK